MTDDDFEIRTVELPILWGGHLRLYGSGRLTITTTEGEDEFDDGHIAAVADLLAEARLIRGATR